MKNNTRKILLAIILVFTMIMSLTTVSAFAADDTAEGSTVYLKPDTNWLTDSPRFAIYAWGTDVEAIWIDMTAADTAGLYQGVVPAGYTNIIFCRMNPNLTENRWNTETDTDETKVVWNQTVDLTVTANGTFTIENPWNSAFESKATGSWDGSSTTDPDVGGGTTEPADRELAVGDYYLAGYINNADYGIVDDAANLGSYKFVDGKLVVELTAKSYVIVKDATNAAYWTASFVDGADNATYYKGDTGEKMAVPAGKVTFTLYKGENGSLILTYTVEEGSGGTVDVPTIDEEDTVTVYAGNSANWDVVYYYCWVTGGEQYVGWPGLEMDLDENGYWFAEVPRACDNIIFSNGEGQQTEDLKTPTDDKNVCDVAGCLKGTGNINSWYTKDTYKPSTPIVREDTDRDVTLVLDNVAGWASVYVYYWSVDGLEGTAWPGDLVEPAEDGLYYVVIPAGNYYVIFNNGQGGEGNQTGDMVIPTDDNVLYDNSTDSWSEKYLEANHPVVDTPDNNDDTTDSGNDGGSEMTFLQKLAKALLLFLRSIEDFFKGLFGKK